MNTPSESTDRNRSFIFNEASTRSGKSYVAGEFLRQMNLVPKNVEAKLRFEDK
jgi:hypothetical protein